MQQPPHDATSRSAHYERYVAELGGGGGATPSSRTVVGFGDTSSSPIRGSTGSPRHHPQRAEAGSIARIALSASHRHLADSPRHGTGHERLASYTHTKQPAKTAAYQLHGEQLREYAQTMKAFNEATHQHVSDQGDVLAEERRRFGESIRAKAGLMPLPPVNKGNVFAVRRGGAANNNNNNNNTNADAVITVGSSPTYSLPSPRKRVLTREVQERLLSPKSTHRKTNYSGNNFDSFFRDSANSGNQNGGGGGPTTPHTNDTSSNPYTNLPRAVALISPRAREVVQHTATDADPRGSSPLSSNRKSAAPPPPAAATMRTIPIAPHQLMYHYGRRSQQQKNTSPRTTGRNKPYKLSPRYDSPHQLRERNEREKEEKERNLPKISSEKMAYLDSLSTTSTVKERLRRLIFEDEQRALRRQEKWEVDAVRVDDLRLRRKNPLREEAIDRITGRKPLSTVHVSPPPAPSTPSHQLSAVSPVRCRPSDDEEEPLRRVVDDGDEDGFFSMSGTHDAADASNGDEQQEIGNDDHNRHRRVQNDSVSRGDGGDVNENEEDSAAIGLTELHATSL